MSGLAVVSHAACAIGAIVAVMAFSFRAGERDGRAVGI